MKKNFGCLIALTCLFLSAVFAQNDSELVLKGQVRAEGEVIMFATLGVVNENVGTVSDQEGYFELKIPQRLSDAYLTVSHVGYQTLHCKIDSLLKLDMISIVLPEKLETLDEVVVSTSRLKGRSKTYGNKKANDVFVWIQDGDIGSEIVTKIAPDKSIFLEGVGVNIQNSANQEFTILLNLYSVDPESGLPAKQLLKEQVVVHSQQSDGWLMVDLKDQNLTMDEAFYVGFQWTTDHTPIPLIGVGLGKSPNRSLLRTHAMGVWKELYNWDIKAIGISL